MVRVSRIERKTEYLPILNGQIKATNDQKGIVEGYLNYIGNVDFGDDRTMPGAFKKTLADSYARKSAQGLDFLWPYLWNHDYSILPPGGIFDAEEDRKGLYTKTQLNLDTQMGRELYSNFKMGISKKQSLGYRALQVDWVKENGKSIRNLLEIQVMEGSCVTFPMNDMAQVDTVKRSVFYMPTLKEMGARIAPSQEKEKVMDIHSKDYAESYQQTNQSDWISDLWNLWYPLRNEILTAFQTGDTIEQDVQSALAQFAPAVLAYVQHGIELNMTDCLQPSDDGDSGGGSMPMMMSSDDNPETKDVKLLSAASHAKMTKAIGGMESHIKELKSELSRQRANALQGYQVYSGKEPPEQKEEDDQEEDETEQKQEQVEDIHSVLHDLTLLLSADNANRGV